MRTGGSRLLEPPNKKAFDIIDLSFLIRIIHQLTIDELRTSDTPIRQILYDEGKEILDSLYTNNQHFVGQDDTKIEQFTTKINTVCNILNR